MAARKTPVAKKPAAKAPRGRVQKYIRNIRNMHASVRLESGRRIELQPRGQRGDCSPVTAAEMKDENFYPNKDLVFEVITEAEAMKVLDKQTTNQQVAHPALEALRSETGEPYDKAVVVEEEFEDRGKVVAKLQLDERGNSIGITRMPVPGSVDRPMAEIPDHVPPEEAADWLARQKTEGPGAGLGNLKVTVEDARKEGN